MLRLIALITLTGLGAALASSSVAQARETDKTPRTATGTLKPHTSAIKVYSETAQDAALESCVNQAGGLEQVDELREIKDATRSKIADLCSKGKREIAQGYARDSATELMQDPRIQELQKCPKEVIKADPELSDLTKPAGVKPNHHICD